MLKREVKESRSDWVAVEAQFQGAGASAGNQPAKAKSAFAYFQKRVMPDVRGELAARAAEANEPLELGAVMKETSARWQQLSAVEREEFVELAAADRRRYDDECRTRDEEVEAERKRKREELHADVDGKRERKRNHVPEEPKVKRAPRELNEKQLEAKRLRNEIRQQEIDERNELKAEEHRQKDELLKKKSDIASARLQYLLSQSDIFAHFSGNVAKKGKKGAAAAAEASAASKRKKRISEEEEDESLLADKHDVVRLTKQPSFEKISGPHIVLVPKSTLSNWLAEFHRWCPSLRAVKFHGDKPERQRVIDDVLCPGLPDAKRKFDVCVTTFEMCLKEKAALCKFAWRYLIIDEAHRIKNEASQFSTVFDEWFNLDVDDDEAKKQMIGQLHKILRPFMLRRLKADVEKSLPPKKETLLFVGMSTMQKALYKSLLLRDMNTITGGAQGVSRSALQNIVMQLRKCCGHPYLFEGQEDRNLDPLGEHVVENCGKMVLMDKLLKKLKQRGSRVLIFTQMTRILDVMEDFCRMRQYEYCRIDGQTSYEDRESSIEEYNRRLQEKQAKLSKNDMLEMIRFGADQVFRAVDSNITDEDIDAILAKGEQRTEEMKQKLQAHDKGDLLDFKLDGGGCQNYDGIDFSNEKERQDELRRLAEAELAKSFAEGMGKRERRTVIRQSHGPADGKRSTLTKSKQLPKALRLPRMDEWQFYNRKRLLELHEIECANYEQAKLETEKPPLPPFAQYLTPDELEEKENLLREGFGDWNKPQFFLFIKLLARYGRGNIDAVAREMGKSLDEVDQYAAKFLARGQDELGDWPKILKSIEKGESKLLEIERLTEETARKVNRYANPWEDMPINYQGKGGKVFTEEEDRVLLCLVNKFGYGSWERIKEELCTLEMFAFDYYLRSRTAAELGRRCDSLMRICEKDNADLEGKERKELEVRAQLHKQRESLDARLAAARDELKRNQLRVDELIMKEAKRMQALREAKRLKKRKERDEKEESVDQYASELAAFVVRATSMDMAKVALEFAALIRESRGEELEASYVLKKIRQIAEPIPNASKGMFAWQLKEEEAAAAAGAALFAGSHHKKLKQEAAADASVASAGGRVKVEEDADSASSPRAVAGGSRLPKSPWSPSAMKQPTVPKGKKEAAKAAGKASEPMVKKPRSAYVLFSIEKRKEVRAEMPAGVQLVEVMTKLSQMWKDMGEDERLPWIEAARQDQLRYEREMNESAA
ncbi:hypothetical protein PybrP1_000860 [[Pythium] brassicae (nom. inval.)]|nr:hypothetical protein PybrP1_000860 [[Pythium] brassicae (nom. inval.)]